MKIIIQSDTKIDKEIIRKIKDIMAESLCPNESLVNSIPKCQGIRGNVIKIGDNVLYETEI